MLVVEAPIEVFVSPATDWDLLVQRLLGLGASRVSFTALPTLNLQKLGAILAHPKVDAAAAADVDHDSSGETVLRVPPALLGIDIPAVSHLGMSSLGIHRYVPGHVRVGSSTLPSLEMLVAQRHGSEVPGGELLIDFFTGPPRSLPRTSLHQVESGQMIPEAVRGRVALVGPVSNRFEATVVTPLTTPRVKVSELEFHAYALDTLLRGSTIRTLSSAAEVGLAAAAWLVTLVIVASVRFRRAMVFATVAVLALVALELTLLPVAHLQLPVVAIILVIGATTVSVLQYKSRQEARELRSLLTTTSVALANRWAPDAPADEKTFWPYLLAMVDQLLPLSRSVLMARVESSRDLRVAGTLRCTPDDIAEEGRDLSQLPYLDAQALEAPRLVPQFLRNGAADEQVLMLPLVAAERLVGIWVFSVACAASSIRPTLVEAFRSVAGKMAEAIVEQRARRDSPDSLGSSFGTDRDLERLADNLQAIDRHFRLSERIFLGLRTPTLVFDVFGRTIAMNKRMKEVVEKTGDPGLISAPYLIEMLCKLPAESAREAVAAVVFEGHEVEHSATCGDDRYLLRATALVIQAAPTRNSQRASPTAEGLQIELLPLGEASAPLDHVHVWDAVERTVARMAALPQFESLTFNMDGARDLPAIAAKTQPFHEALAAIMQLLAEDATLPGAVSGSIERHPQEVVLSFSAKGFGVPPEALKAALSGPRMPISGPLRQIRMLKEAAFGGGSLDIESTLGQGYAVRIVMPIAR